ncbi:MAG: endonuclease III [Candidatus Aminicenantes bacterium]|nr:endonuclease III [Candidatus Aminicenantes bacterium]
MKDILNILDEINRLIQPLRPPVLAFESSIRRTPFRILISVLLSARTKDPVTKIASENLFSAAQTAVEVTALTEERIAELIFPVGFYKQKAAHIKKIAEVVSLSGEIPGNFEGLTALPGVGRKTANLVLALAFNVPAVAVDTHVYRISKRLGWASGSTPGEVEEELKALFPKTHWNKINRTLVGFGQTICSPRNPLCSRCSISGNCPFFKTSGG